MFRQICSVAVYIYSFCCGLFKCPPMSSVFLLNNHYFNYNLDFSFFLLRKNSPLLTPLFGKVSNLGNFNKKALLKPRSACGPVNEAKHTR